MRAECLFSHKVNKWLTMSCHSPVADGCTILINAFYERKTRRAFTSESLFPPLHYKTHSIFKFPHISLWPIFQWDATSVLKKGTADFPARAALNSQTHWHRLSVLLPEVFPPAETWHTSCLLRTEQQHRGMFLKQRKPQMKKEKSTLKSQIRIPVRTHWHGQENQSHRRIKCNDQ